MCTCAASVASVSGPAPGNTVPALLAKVGKPGRRQVPRSVATRQIAPCFELTCLVKEDIGLLARLAPRGGQKRQSMAVLNSMGKPRLLRANLPRPACASYREQASSLKPVIQQASTTREAILGITAPLFEGLAAQQHVATIITPPCKALALRELNKLAEPAQMPCLCCQPSLCKRTPQLPGHRPRPTSA